MNTIETQHWSEDAIEWAQGQPDLATAWKVCERGDWMLWLAGDCAGKPGDDRRRPLVLAACVRDYGRHAGHCNAFGLMPTGCCCGFNDILKDAAEPGGIPPNTAWVATVRQILDNINDYESLNLSQARFKLRVVRVLLLKSLTKAPAATSTTPGAAAEPAGEPEAKP